MEKNKKIILGILLLIFLMITIIVICINKQNQGRDNDPDDDPVVKDVFKRITDPVDFFAIQSTINDVDNVGMNTSYIVKKVYLNSNVNTYYYFINASKFENELYDKDKFLLLILDKNTNYYIFEEIDEPINDLEIYAKEYNDQIINISDGNKFIDLDYNEKNIITIYIEYFKNLLVHDQVTAYDMLHDNVKLKYNGFDDFKNKALQTYDSLSSGVFAYSIEEVENGKTYNVEDNNRNKITLYETEIMNFKISY